MPEQMEASADGGAPYPDPPPHPDAAQIEADCRRIWQNVLKRSAKSAKKPLRKEPAAAET
jgi:hypothetical protein